MFSPSSSALWFFNSFEGMQGVRRTDIEKTLIAPGKGVESYRHDFWNAGFRAQLGKIARAVKIWVMFGESVCRRLFQLF